MNSLMITGADYLVRTLERLGVESVFGIPGVHNLEIYHSMIDSSIKHITTRNESGAGYMADGYARVSGKPGVAFVITGPGLTNIMTSMGQAMHDSVPMVVISSQLPTDLINQHTGFLHELNNSTIMAKSVAKESRTIPAPQLIKEYVESAYLLSMSGRPGPVHIEIPMDVLAAKMPIETEEILEMESKTQIDTEFYVTNTQVLNKEVKRIKPPLNIEIVNKAAELINNKEKITLFVGGGACEAAKEVKILAEKLSAPVIQTAAGKGVLSEEHPLCIGTRIIFETVREFIKEQDIVIAVGTQISPTDLWEKPFEISGKLIQIDADGESFQKNYPADIAIKGDSKDALESLIDLVQEKTIDIENKVKELIEVSTSKVSDLSGIVDTYDQVISMLDTVRETLPKDGIFVTDMTTAAYVGLSEYKTYLPRTYLHPIGFGTLGYSMPAAIGAKVNMPDRDVVALIGDGGFQFTMQELAVACDLKMPLPIIIWNNDGFGEIRRYEEAGNFKEHIAVDHNNPDFMVLAKAYGIEGFQPTTQKELAEAIKSALTKENPTIIEVHIDKWRG